MEQGQIDIIGLWTAVKELALKAVPSIALFAVINGITILKTFFIEIKGDSITQTG